MWPSELLDWLLFVVAVLITRLTGWSPAGQRVRVRQTDGPPGVAGASFTGTLEEVRLLKRAGKTVQAAVITLDEPMSLPQVGIVGVKRIVVLPRYRWHRPLRLRVGTVVVNMYETSPTESGVDLLGQPAEMLGIGTLSLTE